jgi:hypothetical protein
MATKLLLTLPDAPGDTLAMTAAVRDLVAQYPGEYDIGVDTNADTLWHGNPHVTICPLPADRRVLDMRYARRIAPSARAGTHFLRDFCLILGDHLERPVELLRPTPDIHWLPTEAQRHPLAPSRPYWAIFPGWKYDMPVKRWSPQAWQAVVDMLESWGIHCVQLGGGIGVNPLLAGVTSLVGRTTLRGMLQVIRDAEGVICGITQAMHVAAALEKPCVVLAGGRETRGWAAYTNDADNFGPQASRLVPVPHRVLHSGGLLDCCRNMGCYKRAFTVSKRHDARELCTMPVELDVTVGACQTLITPTAVVDAVLSYYEDGTLARPADVVARPAPPLSPPAPYAEVCMLLHGDYPDMHAGSLAALLQNTPAEQPIRLIANAVTGASVERVQDAARDPRVRVVWSPENLPKYEWLGRLLYGRDGWTDTIKSPWLVWLDDDSYCLSPTWLSRMLAATTAPNVGMVGPLHLWQCNQKWLTWLHQSPWHRIPYGAHQRTGRPAVRFCVGSLWALHTATAREFEIPDRRLVHTRGDITMGAQLYQAGRAIVHWGSRDTDVRFNAAPRRGMRGHHPCDLPVAQMELRHAVRGHTTPQDQCVRGPVPPAG